jgi:hypothetical protein
MTLLTAHRILIAAAVLLFAGYAARELAAYAGSGDPWTAAAAAASAVAAIALGIYWWTIPRA